MGSRAEQGGGVVNEEGLPTTAALQGFPEKEWEAVRTRVEASPHLLDVIDTLSASLAAWIESVPTPCFLLRALLEYVARVNELGLTAPLRYQIASFEGWMQRRSSLSEERKSAIRAKIAGAQLPRQAYQYAFPIGKGETLPGAHIVSAHSAPDLDTVTASFWSWLDAFAAKLADTVHLWNVPGGLPDLVEVDLLWRQAFSPGINHLPKSRKALVLTAFDLITTSVPLRSVALSTGLHTILPEEGPVAVVNGAGHLVGELHLEDIEAVRRCTTPALACVHWYTRRGEQMLAQGFARGDEDARLCAELAQLWELPLSATEPFSMLDLQQATRVEKTLALLLDITTPDGIHLRALAQAAERRGAPPLLAPLQKAQEDLLLSPEPRARFALLAQFGALMEGFAKALREWLESVEIALQIKETILKRPHRIVATGADVEQMRHQLGDADALVAALSDRDGSSLPEGLVLAQDLLRHPVGTLSLRDFSNLYEVLVPDYLQVVSGLDHHRISLRTQQPPVIQVADVQAANTLLVEQLQQQLLPYYQGAASLQGTMRPRQGKGCPQCWVAPERLWWQSVHQLFAILDDTDQLAKLSWRDAHAVCACLHLIGDLSGADCSSLTFEDLPMTIPALDTARQRLLRAPLLRRMQAPILKKKRDRVAEALHAASAGHASQCFQDLKIQNRCAAVSQLKVYPENHTLLRSVAPSLHQEWLVLVQAIAQQRPEIDLYVHMVSTLGEEKHSSDTEYDELWLWTPPPQGANAHLRVFLSNLGREWLEPVRGQCSLSLLGPEQGPLKQLVSESVPWLTLHSNAADLPSCMGLLLFPARHLNSRKGAITPCLPAEGL